MIFQTVQMADIYTHFDSVPSKVLISAYQDLFCPAARDLHIGCSVLEVPGKVRRLRWT